jgi:hypothetical protein
MILVLFLPFSVTAYERALKLDMVVQYYSAPDGARRTELQRALRKNLDLKSLHTLHALLDADAELPFKHAKLIGVSRLLGVLRCESRLRIDTFWQTNDVCRCVSVRQ